MTVKSENSRIFHLEQQLVLTICEDVNSPRSLAVSLLVRNREFSQLASLEWHAHHYDERSLDKARYDYLVTSLLSKNSRLPLGIDRKAVAIEKFREAERMCAETNERLSSFSRGTGTMPVDRDVADVISHARLYIRKILGKLTRNKLSFAENNMRFGPGATTSISRRVSQGLKYSKRQLDATPRVADFFVHCLPAHWREYCAPDLALRQTSKLTTVPKNAKTDRCICIEPDVNVYVQLGIGALIRDRLLRYGLDLSTQKNNQDAARRAWSEGLCTLDLRSASDTVSREVVWALLDPEWVELLLFARVDRTLYEGEVIELEKWSSMGNGYTFELETLLFYGILLGACEVEGSGHGEVLAYGDDLIMPAAHRDLVTRTLNFLGFSVNTEKSFGEGLFYESCGADFFCGRDIRPIFLRSEDATYEETAYQYANLASHYSNRVFCGWGRDSLMRSFWNHCYRSVAARRRFHIPNGYGDGGFQVDLDFASRDDRVQRTRIRDGWCSVFRFEYLLRRGIRRMTDGEGVLTHSLRSPTEFSLGLETQRGDFKLSRKVGHISTWPNLGPWI